MKDIVPELYQRILEDFNNTVESNRDIQSFNHKLQKRTASQEAVHIYAANMGRCAADALEKNLTRENMPDGKLYWNILERTMDPLMRIVHEMIMEAAVTVMKYEDEKVGIHLNPIVPDYPKERVKSLMESILSKSNE